MYEEIVLRQNKTILHTLKLFLFKCLKNRTFMKNLKFSLLGIFFLGVFMMSCSKEEPTSFEIKNAKEIISQFNAGKLESQKGEVIYGQVYMRSTDDHQLLVFVQNADFEEEILLYKFQTKKLQDPLFKEIINKAQIFYFQNQLIVNDIDSSRRFSLRLTDANDNLKVDEEGSLISGFGLSRMTVNLNSQNDGGASRKNERNLQRIAGKPGTSQPVGTSACVCSQNRVTVPCNSGRHGAISCSGAYGPNRTPCEVTCVGGYYACCNAE